MSDTPSIIPSPEMRLQELQAVLFDLDGTLIDTVELILVSMRHATREVLGAAPPDDVLMSGVGMPLLTQFRGFAPDHVDELLRVYREFNHIHHCLLYTSDAADDLLCVDLGGRRIIKKKKKKS